MYALAYTIMSHFSFLLYLLFAENYIWQGGDWDNYHFGVKLGSVETLTLTETTATRASPARSKKTKY